MATTNSNPADLDPAQVVRAIERMTPDQRRRVRLVLAESYGRSVSELTDKPRMDRRESED